MQNLNENFSEFSSPCVDNSIKNQEKSVKNSTSVGALTENEQKSAISAEKTAKNAYSKADFTQNPTVLASNDDKGSKNGEIQPQAEENQPKAQENQPQNSESISNDGKNPSALTYEEQIERDFKDFEAIYPNISKKSLLDDENLRIFAEGKENKQFSVIYAKFRKLSESIANEAILQEKARQANASSASGALSSSQGANSAYFTREQVKAMSPSEIKRNYELIRQSQQNW